MGQQQCMKAIVSGRVQGVCFRRSTQQQAEALGIVGYARNLADGRVEVLMCGEAERLAALREWLAQGPPGAEVTHLECRDVEAVPPDGFTTG
ncbi:acylphosphatase [Halomonas sabkhae]|uniref:acylphosphatase n=1 Tax=Halomonas sabkhae TaxID=626223 RepID=UPI0025B2C1B6|nr:acylphosphatase [Halomonas sabkhae]MDN3526466.1 acylphosphatase [Halomonas sabkhae]